MAQVPFPPFDDRPVQRRTWGVGMDYGPTRRTGATVRHTMVGWLASTDSYFRMAGTKALTPWGIGTEEDGPDLDGKIYRWLDVTAGKNVVPWASGPFLGGEGDFRTYFVPRYGGSAVNNYAEAIETSGLVGTEKSAKCLSSLIHLEAAIKSRAGIDFDEFLWSFDHWEVCGKAYKACPFSDVSENADALNQGIANLLRYYHHGSDVPEYITIQGRRIPLVLGQKQDGPVNLPKPPIFVELPNKPTFHTFPGAVGRSYASTNAPIKRKWDGSGKFRAIGYVNGQEVNGDDRWLVAFGKSKLRVHVSGVREDLE